jgi:fluoride exporter
MSADLGSMVPGKKYWRRFASRSGPVFEGKRGVNTLWQVLAVMAGGGAGSLVRWLVQKAIAESPVALPGVAVAAVNLVGCLLIGGLLAPDVAGRARLGELGRLFLVTGLLGGLTTFSTFAFEVVDEGARRGQPVWAGVLIVLNVAGGCGMVLLGRWIASEWLSQVN